MKVTSAITEHKGRLLSVEIEPPLLGKTREESLNLLEPLVELGVAYVDITYHAQKVVSYADGHAYAKELIAQIAGLREGRYFGVASGEKMDFCIGAACFPEAREGNTLAQELEQLKQKADAGADYFVTQMFFDAAVYARFAEQALAAGIEQPLVPGIKPLTSVSHLELLPEFFSCAIPPELKADVERFSGSRADVRKAGIEWCIKQCDKLREYGAPSLHFYAARNAPVAEIIRSLG